MKASHRPQSCWIAFASFAAVLVLAAPARAFTDANAEMKEAASEPAARVVVTDKAAPRVRTPWVPPTAKSLDGFKPVSREDRTLMASRSQALAQAQAKPAVAAKR